MTNHDILDKKLPKIIWMYWHQGFDKAPQLVKKCIEQWQQLHPHWKLHLLDHKKVYDFIDPLPIDTKVFEKLTLAHRSDLIRTQLLIQHGGVWADPTCFPLQPLDDWLYQNFNAGIFLFSKPGRDRIISNWFIASIKEHEILIKLLSDLCLYWSDNVFVNMSNSQRWYEPWVKRIYSQNLTMTRLWFTWFTRKCLKLYPYMIYHYTFYKIISSKTKYKKYWKKMSKISADGPHKLQRIGLLSPVTKEAQQLIDSKTMPIFKLTWKLKAENWSPNSVLAYLFKRE